MTIEIYRKHDICGVCDLVDDAPDFCIDDVEDFETWVNRNYTAYEVLGNDEIDLSELEEIYNREIIDPAVEAFFTDSEYFAWL